MQVKTLWQFQLLSEIASFNTIKAANLQLNAYSVKSAQQLSLKLLPFGNTTQLIFDADKFHTIKPYDFPSTLYFDLVLQDKFTLSAHDLQQDLNRQGFYFELNTNKEKNLDYLDISELSYFIFPETSLTALMTKGEYTLFNNKKEKIVDCLPPYNARFDSVLDERFGSYYLSNTESDTVHKLIYTPKAAKNSIAVLSLTLDSFKGDKPIELSLKMKARAVQIRYNFVFRNETEKLSCTFHNKSGQVEFVELGEKVLMNGQKALKFASAEFLKFDEIQKQEPFYVMPNQQIEYDGLNTYYLPEKIYLPNIDKSAIKADEKGYFIEHFITV